MGKDGEDEKLEREAAQRDSNGSSYSSPSNRSAHSNSDEGPLEHEGALADIRSKQSIP